ncbi:MAG: APC family permease [Steroidobacteraceae bacterium]
MSGEPATRLQEDALGIGESVVMGVAGTAPAFSLAATTAALIAAVGSLSAGSLLYCGLIMFGVTFAFMHLNRVIASAGASYSWVGEVFGPAAGFIAGWSLLVSSAVFMVSGTTPAATATLLLISPSHADKPWAISLVAAIWLVLVSLIIVRGIKPTSFSQVAMTVIEVGVLVILIIAAFIEYGAHPTHPMALRSFYLTEFTPTMFATGALTALFFFWGWDVTLNLTEETRNATHAPGHSAVSAMIIVSLLFVTFVIACQFVLTDREIAQSSTNVVFALARKLLPDPWSYLAIVAVMVSTVGTLETQILQFTRTMYAKGRDGALHPRYAILHAEWQTPWVATALLTGIGLALIFLSSLMPSVGELIKVSVNAIGFQVACYYSLAGFACAWHFRHSALTSAHRFVFLFAWPAFSALFLVFIAVYSVPTFDLVTNIVGIGGILVGIVPFLLNRRRHRALARPMP